MSSTPTTNRPRGAISGRVLDVGNNRTAVAGANVMIVASPFPQREIAARTGSDGSFRLSGLRPGEYTVAIMSPGFDPVNINVVVEPSEVIGLEVHLGA